MKLKKFLKEGRTWGMVTTPAVNKLSTAKPSIKEYSDREVDMMDRELSSLRKMVKSLEARIAALEKANKVNK
jgi:hypothetical protein